MGLDVYLRKCDDLAAAQAIRDQYNAEEEAIYAKYPDSCDDALRHDLRAELARKLGTDEYGGPNTVEYIERPSEQHPDHLFKIGYFRSSYNEGGINGVLPSLGLPSLYDIFPESKCADAYEFAPDWRGAMERATSVRDQLAEIIASQKGQYAVGEIRFSPFVDKPDVGAEKALEIAIEALNLKCPFDSFSSTHGYFYTRGLTIYAAVLGRDFLGEPCVYIITRPTENPYQWYLQALDIVVETCQYVLHQPDAEKYYLVWSG